MYSHFDGKLVEKKPSYAIIECNGVGFMLQISLHTFSQIKDKEKCKLYAHLVVREDAQMLFGFYGEEERSLFRHLITVSGIGANTARMILSSLSPDEAVDAILSGNVSTLQAVKGIGAKTAQRVILDLKDKLSKGEISKDIISSSYNTNKEESLSALIMLGFNKNVAEKAILKVLKEKGQSISVEEIVKDALNKI